MEIYNLYYIVMTILSMSNVPVPGVFYYALAFGVVLWIGLFVLQGFGLYAMAKRRGMEDKWKVFVPFVNKFPKDTKLYRLITTKPNETF